MHHKQMCVFLKKKKKQNTRKPQQPESPFSLPTLLTFNLISTFFNFSILLAYCPLFIFAKLPWLFLCLQGPGKVSNKTAGDRTRTQILSRFYSSDSV